MGKEQHGGRPKSGSRSWFGVPLTHGDNAPLLQKGLNETGLWKGDELRQGQRAGHSPDVPHRLDSRWQARRDRGLGTGEAATAG